MKPEIPLKGGDEYDMLTGWRHVLHHRPGQIKKIKRGYWKRVRRVLRRVLPSAGEEE